MGESSDAVIIMVADHLDELATRVHHRIGDVAGVAVTMASQDGPTTVGASTELARRVDHVQFRIGFGPCLQALRGHGGLYVPDLAVEQWGEYGQSAAELGVRCCVSLPVERGGEVLAVAKVYAAEVDGLTEEQRRLATDLATEVAGTIGLARSLTTHARELDDRTRAMDTRRTIDLALGVIMERAHCSSDAAFATLRKQSQHTNMPLADVARVVLAGLGEGVETSAPFQRAGG